MKVMGHEVNGYTVSLLQLISRVIIERLGSHVVNTYPLVIKHSYIESGFLMGKLTMNGNVQ